MSKKVHFRLVLALISAVFCSPATAYEWNYSPLVNDMPIAAMLSSGAFSSWQSSQIKGLVASVFDASACTLSLSGPLDPGALVIGSCSFPSGPTLAVSLMIPAHGDATNPAVYILPAWGADEPSFSQFAADGYLAVHIKFQSWYNALAPLYNQNGYLPVWGNIAARIMQQVEQVLPAHSGYSVVSSATGSLVAPYFLLYQTTPPRSVVTNGILLSLDWLRRNYRYCGWPNFWDDGRLISFTDIYLTMAPNPTQWQMGSADAFSPNPKPLAGDGCFSGAPRGQSVDEVYGQFLTLKHAWELLGGHAEISLGSNGHVAVDYPAAKAFIQAN